MRIPVYICSPYAGDICRNVENARRYSRFAVKAGFMPVTPHLMYTQFLDENIREERTIGLLCGLKLLTFCSELWIFGDRMSSGMAQEKKAADALGMRVRYFREYYDAAEDKTDIREVSGI